MCFKSVASFLIFLTLGFWLATQTSFSLQRPVHLWFYFCVVLKPAALFEHLSWFCDFIKFVQPSLFAFVCSVRSSGVLFILWEIFIVVFLFCCFVVVVVVIVGLLVFLLKFCIVFFVFVICFSVFIVFYCCFMCLYQTYFLFWSFVSLVFWGKCTNYKKPKSKNKNRGNGDMLQISDHNIFKKRELTHTPP